MASRRLKIAFASSELAPWCRTGGLGDVVGSLPQALADEADVAVFVPLHRSVKAKTPRLRETGIEVAVPMLGRAQRGRVLELVQDSPVRTFFLDAPLQFDRDGLYGHGDDALRYGFFSRAVLACAAEAMGGAPDVLHAHDWMTALVPILLPGVLPGARSVFTIHNLAYQGVFPKELLGALGLSWEQFRFDHLEFYDQLNLMKGAITAADAVTTVSPTYAQEILTPPFGQNLDAHLRAHAGKLSGIVNGLDLVGWDPATDPALPANYDASNLAGKEVCRAELRRRFGLPDTGEPVVGVASRFTEQKGLDLVVELAQHLPGVQLAVLGTGDRWLEQRFEDLAVEFPGRIGVQIAFDDALARLLIAGADILLMPSRFEPCGLTQLQAMRYGTVPVVQATGGLRDTVIDAGDGVGDGFVFEGATVQGLREALQRAVELWEGDQPAWAALRERGMARDRSWAPSAQQYLALYRRLVSG